MYKRKLFYYHIIAALTIGVLSINTGITFAQEKNETSEIDDSGLITTTEIDEIILHLKQLIINL